MAWVSPSWGQSSVGSGTGSCHPLARRGYHGADDGVLVAAVLDVSNKAAWVR
jgi:hypothetical protein